MYDRLKALTVSADVGPDNAVDESRYFSQRVLDVLDSVDSSDWSKHAESYTEIESFAKMHIDGILASGLNNVARLLKAYTTDEAVFAELELSDDAEKDDLMQDLRRKYIEEPHKVHALALSHYKRKNKLVMDCCASWMKSSRRSEATICSPSEEHPKDRALGGQSTSEVALSARQRLAMLENPLLSDAELWER